MLGCCGVVVLGCWGVGVLWCCWCCGVGVLWCCGVVGVVVLWCCGVVVLWCCVVVLLLVLWCCGVVVLCCCVVVVLWCCRCCGVVVLWCCGVVDFIKLVNNDYDIEFLSSCGVEQHNFQKKCLEQALYNKNIPIVLTCLPLRADKFDIIKKRKPCLILDDKRDFVEKCNAKGFKATYSRDFKELIKILKS